VLVDGARALDVVTASGGRFGSSRDVFWNWEDFDSWASTVVDGAWSRFLPGELGTPVDSPRQVFAAGLNYRAHRDEAVSTFELKPEALPMIFTKFTSSITGPTSDIVLGGDRVDFEVELVVVIGREARRVGAPDAWSHVAGLTVGQDVSDRAVQYLDPQQFSIAKSFPTYSPIGPVVVTLDEFSDPDDLAIECSVNGEVQQSARTTQLLYSVPKLIEFLSSTTTLLPGDLVFTGTPAGVGHRQEVPRFLQPGDVITSRIEGIGELENRCVGGDDLWTASRYEFAGVAK
jgi:2-keto-4-pentenoate hydratase/2-oxohepta-3-ene-1,7-dioic acid hydratase in catechol pathway